MATQDDVVRTDHVRHEVLALFGAFRWLSQTTRAHEDCRRERLYGSEPKAQCDSARAPHLERATYVPHNGGPRIRTPTVGSRMDGRRDQFEMILRIAFPQKGSGGYVFRRLGIAGWVQPSFKLLSS
jgi:hypothetical protein